MLQDKHLLTASCTDIYMSTKREVEKKGNALICCEKQFGELWQLSCTASWEMSFVGVLRLI